MLLYFFTGFVIAAQVGGRMLDRVGARRPVIIGATLAAIGLHLWATHVTTLAAGTQIPFIVLAGDDREHADVRSAATTILGRPAGRMAIRHHRPGFSTRMTPSIGAVAVSTDADIAVPITSVPRAALPTPGDR